MICISSGLIDFTLVCFYFPVRSSMPIARYQKVCDAIIVFMKKYVKEAPHRSTVVCAGDLNSEIAGIAIGPNGNVHVGFENGMFKLISQSNGTVNDGLPDAGFDPFFYL